MKLSSIFLMFIYILKKFFKFINLLVLTLFYTVLIFIIIFIIYISYSENRNYSSFRKVFLKSIQGTSNGYSSRETWSINSSMYDK